MDLVGESGLVDLISSVDLKSGGNLEVNTLGDVGNVGLGGTVKHSELDGSRLGSLASIGGRVNIDERINIGTIVLVAPVVEVESRLVDGDLIRELSEGDLLGTTEDNSKCTNKFISNHIA
jgi:hypothetical protein